MMGSQPDMEPKPGKFRLGSGLSRAPDILIVDADMGAFGLCLPLLRCLIVAGNFLQVFEGVAEGPSGIVESGGCSRWVGRDANPPVLIQQHWRAHRSGIEDNLGFGQGSARSRLRPGVWLQLGCRFGNRRRRTWLGDQMHGRAGSRQSYFQNRFPQKALRSDVLNICTLMCLLTSRILNMPFGRQSHSCPAGQRESAPRIDTRPQPFRDQAPNCGACSFSGMSLCPRLAFADCQIPAAGAAPELFFPFVTNKRILASKR